MNKSMSQLDSRNSRNEKKSSVGTTKMIGSKKNDN